MKTKISLLSALMIASLGIASAQQPGEQPGAQPGQQPGAQPGQPGEQELAAAGQARSGDFLTRLEEGMIRTDELERADLVDPQGEDIGNIAGVVIDQETGQVAGVIVNLGGVAGVGARDVALSWDAIEIVREGDGGEQYQVRTQMSQQELENAPELEGDDDQIALGQ